MGIYKYIRNAWKKPSEGLGNTQKLRLQEWRRQPATVRISRPTRLDRARSLGYRAKQGFVIVRQRVLRGGRKREKIKHGRTPRKFHRNKVVSMSLQTIAERRANQKFVNCEVLSSYYAANDGQYEWYEIILVDKNHPVIKNDPTLKWIADKANTKRAFRGLTSSGRKSRGLRKKGTGAEKIRPSLRANERRAH